MGSGGESATGGVNDFYPDTPFNTKGLRQLKEMLESANVAAVREAAQAWKEVHDELVVDREGDPSILTAFTKAVEKAVKDWHGPASEKFVERANQIISNIRSGATYPKVCHEALTYVAEQLQTAYSEIRKIEEPDFWDEAGDWLTDPIWRDDSQLGRDLKNSNMTTQQALEANHEELTVNQERSLQAAVHMENLAMSYKQTQTRIGTPAPPRIPEESIRDHPESSSPALTPIMPVPAGGSPRPITGSAMPSASRGIGHMPPNPVGSPRPQGISGGIGAPGAQVGTGLSGHTGITGGVGGSGVGNPGGGVGNGAGGAGSGAPGMPGMPGGMGAGAARGGAGVGAARSGAGAGPRGGRPGMPGMGGTAGAGAGDARGAGGARSGATARTTGGVAGAVKGATGTGIQGGSGLHRSRGGAQADPAGTGRGVGTTGAPGAHGANADQRQGGENRPDYLVEEEETWTPQRDVAPRVIE